MEMVSKLFRNHIFVIYLTFMFCNFEQHVKAQDILSEMHNEDTNLEPSFTSHSSSIKILPSSSYFSDAYVENVSLKEVATVGILLSNRTNYTAPTELISTSNYKRLHHESASEIAYVQAVEGFFYDYEYETVNQSAANHMSMASQFEIGEIVSVVSSEELKSQTIYSRNIKYKLSSEESIKPTPTHHSILKTLNIPYDVHAYLSVKESTSLGHSFPSINFMLQSSKVSNPSGNVDTSNDSTLFNLTKTESVKGKMPPVLARIREKEETAGSDSKFPDIKCPVFVPSTLSHEFSITFFVLSNYSAKADLPKSFEVLLRTVLNDSNCNSIVRTSFIDGWPFIFSWTNASVAGNFCFTDELQNIAKKMFHSKFVNSEFSQSFLPDFNITSVKVKHMGVCLYSNNGPNILVIVVSIVFALGALPCVFIVMVKLFRVRPKVIKRRRESNVVLKGRPPLILHSELNKFYQTKDSNIEISIVSDNSVLKNPTYQDSAVESFRSS